MLKNYTPHPIHLMVDGKVTMTLPSAGSIRLQEEWVHIGEVDGIPVHQVTYSAGDIPPRVEGITIVVSAMVADAFPDRDDLVSPLGLVRDGQGRIIGCTALRGQAPARVPNTVLSALLAPTDY